MVKYADNAWHALKIAFANEIGEIETRYNEVKHALDKIEGYPEKYGMCEVSNQPIEHDRLEANPAARTCKKHLEN